jgi:chorismate-pyruvate lyase
MMERGSLTGRLREDLGQEVKVECLSETRQRDRVTGREVLRREVRLFCGGRPRVHAVSLIPVALLSAHPWLAELGDQPLGDPFFATPGAGRGLIQVARLGPDSELARRASLGLDNDGAGMWARRSRLNLSGQAITVTECFYNGETDAPVG